jgi:hypothetical protein
MAAPLSIIYEGHDAPRRSESPDPKTLDQPEVTSRGTLTENGKFHKSAQDFQQGLRQPELVRVYEKLHQGIWSYNGLFHLVNSWKEHDGYRTVFKFELAALEGEREQVLPQSTERGRRRVIPTAVKLEVWNRDEAKCVICGATDELHFDHVVPFSKGGTSLSAENVQILCARHNLEKRDRIQ